MGYMETTRIVIEQLGLLSVCFYIFPLLVTFVDREDNMDARLSSSSVMVDECVFRDLAKTISTGSLLLTTVSAILNKGNK